MTGERYAVRTVDGTEIRFHKLTPYDRADILKCRKREMWAQLVENLKLAGAEKAEILGELQAFDAAIPGEADFVNFVNTPEGMADVIRRALLKADPAGGQAAFEALTLALDDTLPLVAELCGLKLRQPAPADDTSAYGEEGPANPPRPEETDSYASSPATAPMPTT